ncbi:MAG TPA: OmpA family protein [Kofleriaceae bacterium]|nr:OmpA family protein [Kofleriaceae bacterium]
MRWLLASALVVFAACAHTSTTTVATKQPAQPADRPEPRGKVKVVTDTHVEILDPIKFLSGSPSIEPSSGPILDAIAGTLTGNPSIKLVEIIAYGADAVPSLQQSVAVARAQAVVGELIARGVESRRLRASGEAVPQRGMGPGPTFLILERAQ